MKVLSLLLLTSALLHADGGALQWKSRAGPFNVTVFTAPVPLRAGPADISVLVERADDKSIVLDADVTLHLPKQNLTLHATHALSTNKIMYAAEADLSTPGTWDSDLVIQSPAGTGSAHGRIQVLPAEPPLAHDWPYLAVVPTCILLFIVNQILKARRRKI